MFVPLNLSSHYSAVAVWYFDDGALDVPISTFQREFFSELFIHVRRRCSVGFVLDWLSLRRTRKNLWHTECQHSHLRSKWRLSTDSHSWQVPNAHKGSRIDSLMSRLNLEYDAESGLHKALGKKKKDWSYLTRCVVTMCSYWAGIFWAVYLILSAWSMDRCWIVHPAKFSYCHKITLVCLHKRSVHAWARRDEHALSCVMLYVWHFWIKFDWISLTLS